MNKTFKFLLYPLLFVEIMLLKFYKLCISPLKKSMCAYIPTCSHYMMRSINKFGPIKGLKFGFKRLLKCNGKNLGGVDLEPLNILGDYKWVC